MVTLICLSSLEAKLLSQQLARGAKHRVGSKAELLQQFFERGRSAKGLHADDLAPGADVFGPAHGRCLLDGDSRRYRRWQDTLAVLSCLLLEQLPGGHTDDANFSAFAG